MSQKIKFFVIISVEAANTKYIFKDGDMICFYKIRVNFIKIKGEKI